MSNYTQNPEEYVPTREQVEQSYSFCTNVIEEFKRVEKLVCKLIDRAQEKIGDDNEDWTETKVFTMKIGVFATKFFTIHLNMLHKPEQLFGAEWCEWEDHFEKLSDQLADLYSDEYWGQTINRWVNGT